MNHCLSEKALYLLYAGDENRSQRLHLTQCAKCARYYEQLSQRLSSVEQILQESPPPSFHVAHATEGQSQFVYHRQFSFAVVAVVVAFALIWELRWQKESSQQGLPRIANQDVTRFFEREVSPALFATADVSAPRLPLPVSDLAYLEAALSDSWPCAQRETVNTLGCDIHPFPLPSEDY